jgi:hypothetical protein
MSSEINDEKFSCEMMVFLVIILYTSETVKTLDREESAPL